MSCSAVKSVCFGRLILVVLLLALAGGVLCAQTSERRLSEQKSGNASEHDVKIHFRPGSGDYEPDYQDNAVLLGRNALSVAGGGMELSESQRFSGRSRKDRQHSQKTSHRKDGQTSGVHFGSHIQQHTTTSTFASDWEHVFQCPSRKYRRCRPVRFNGPEPESYGQEQRSCSRPPHRQCRRRDRHHAQPLVPPAGLLLGAQLLYLELQEIRILWRHDLNTGDGVTYN